MNTKHISTVVTAFVLLGTLLSGGVAFAKTDNPNANENGQNRSAKQENNGVGWMMSRNGSGLYGTVSAINGTTLTVTVKKPDNNTTNTTYTVNASGATVTKDGVASTFASVAVGDTVSIAGTISGTTMTATAIYDGIGKSMMGRGGMMNGNTGVTGTVASVSGSTITVNAKKGKDATTTTYTVNVGSATITKHGATSAIASIIVGDTVRVRGTVSGTTVTATNVDDMGVKVDKETLDSLIQGNGQPVVAGTVTVVSGTTITITNKSNVTYTVNAGSATIVKAGATSTIANVLVGDAVLVQGTVNGTAITASSVIDSGGVPTSTGTTTGHKGGFGGFMGNVGSFFHTLFGFF